MWERALTQAISRSSTWDLVIGLIAILMYKMVTKLHEKDDATKTKNTTPKVDIIALKYMFYLGLTTLAARVIITVVNLVFK